MHSFSKSFVKYFQNCTSFSNVYRSFSSQSTIIAHRIIPESKTLISQEQKNKMRILRESDPVMYTPERLAEMFHVDRMAVKRITKAPSHKRNELLRAEQEVGEAVQQEKRNRLADWVKKNTTREQKNYFLRKVHNMGGHILREYRIDLKKQKRDIRADRRKRFSKELSALPPHGAEKRVISATRAKKLAKMDVPPTIVQGF